MTNFGVQPFLEEFLQLAPKPGIKMSSEGEVDPESDKFTGFVFKIQANMNPPQGQNSLHQNLFRTIYPRMTVYHVQQGKEVRLSQPQQFMAQERTIVEEAYAEI